MTLTTRVGHLPTRSRRVRFRDAPLRKSWSYASNTLMFFFISAIFVFFLNQFSARTGAIIKVITPAASSQFTDRKIDNLPVLRLALGQPISYDLDWYYLENCQTTVTMEFAQSFDEPNQDRVRLIVEKEGKHYPVGGPGLDHLMRQQPVGIKPGLWKYTTTVNALCANGRRPLPQTTSQFYIDIFDPRQPALVLEAPVEFLTKQVKKTDRLHWRVDIKRNIVGPTTALFTFISKDAGISGAGVSDVITIQRPGLNMQQKPGSFKNLDFYQDLPAEIHSGGWRLQASAITNLPDGRVQTDQLFTASFEVLP